MRPSTQLVHFDPCPGDPYRPTSTPIYQTATFEQEDPEGFGEFDYTRSGNPTRRVLEEVVARLEGARRAFAFASGMAAITAVCRLVPAGGEIVAGDDLYGGTFRLLDRVLPRHGITARFVPLSDPLELASALSPRTSLVLLETPTNPLHRVSDIAALSQVAHARGAKLAVDNSLLSPYLQNPLALGADLVIHSATKWLSGHADVTAGVVATSDPELASEIGFLQNAEGAALAPFESWLLLRGMKTLALRLERQQANAHEVARFLAAHPLVKKVHYLGLPDHPGREVHARQARGAGAVVSLETGSLEHSRTLARSLSLFTLAVSFGSLSSTVSLPCSMSHASIPKRARQDRGLPEDLVRLSVGIEDAADLLADLDHALSTHSEEKAGARRGDELLCSSG